MFVSKSGSLVEGQRPREFFRIRLCLLSLVNFFIHYIDIWIIHIDVYYGKYTQRFEQQLSKVQF